MGLLETTLAAIRPADQEARARALAHQERLTKPRGSLGALEDVAVRLAGSAGTCPPPLPSPAALAIFAADHGVHAQGVTPWPQEVTGQMVANFLAGGAVANAFAAQAGATVTVVDVGVAAELPPAPGLVVRKVAPGTADMSLGPAMTPEQARAALEAGITVARELVDAGARCLITGDMGIANTTASAALICAFTGSDPVAATGRGTGVDDATLNHKIDIVRRALQVNGLSTPEPARVTPEGATGPGAEAVTTVPEGIATGPKAVPTTPEAVTTGAKVVPTTPEAVTTGAKVVPTAPGAVTSKDGMSPTEALRRLAAVGGLEHAALAGFVLGGAAARVAVILDGVIAGSAALAAAALAPAAIDHCVAGHLSAEPGHAIALDRLGLRALVDLGLRLGEGTGALLAYPLVAAAARVMHEVATFDSAGVTEKDAQTA